MDNQKLENQLALALETSEEIREKTIDLNEGYDAKDKTWELIVKYNGSLDELNELGIRVEYLIAGYAILTVPESLVDYVGGLEQIEYVEKPKKIYFDQFLPSEDYCIPLVTQSEPYLTGKGVIIAIIDSGVNYYRDDFKDLSGNNRIISFWDQENDKVYSGEELENIFMPDLSGHGTAVCGIATGYSRESGYRGVAVESDIIVVKLSSANANDYSRTTQIMRGVNFALKAAESNKRPLVINLSLGNNYGPHDGTALLERFLDNAAEIGKCAICVGAGNEGVSRKHYSLEPSDINPAGESRVEFVVDSYENSINLQIWKNYTCDFNVLVRNPVGEQAYVAYTIEGGKYTVNLGADLLLLYYGEPTPYSAKQEIYLEIVAEVNEYITEGIWSIEISGGNSGCRQCEMYINSASQSQNTGFVLQSVDATFTVPSTADRVITVGAYDAYNDVYSPFSGRGFRMNNSNFKTNIKPDLVASGVDVLAPFGASEYAGLSGTSFSTPIVSGICALMMEWGIVRGNDPYLYGEKLKAYLQKGAVRLRGESSLPNNRVGYGKACIYDSLFER